MRSERYIPTLFTVFLARKVGAQADIVRPGCVEISFPDGKIEICIHIRNIYRDEAEAYRIVGEPVPSFVLEDLKKWEIEHNGLR